MDKLEIKGNWNELKGRNSLHIHFKLVNIKKVKQ